MRTVHRSAPGVVCCRRQSRTTVDEAAVRRRSVVAICTAAHGIRAVFCALLLLLWSASARACVRTGPTLYYVRTTDWPPLERTNGDDAKRDDTRCYDVSLSLLPSRRCSSCCWWCRGSRRRIARNAYYSLFRTLNSTRTRNECTEYAYTNRANSGTGAVIGVRDRCGGGGWGADRPRIARVRGSRSCVIIWPRGQWPVDGAFHGNLIAFRPPSCFRFRFVPGTYFFSKKYSTVHLNTT